MTQSLTWNLHGNDNLSAILEKLDRTVSKLDRTMAGATSQARQYGSALSSVNTPTTKFQSSVETTNGHLEGMTSKLAGVVGMLRNLALVGATALVSAGAAAGAFGIKLAAANETAAVSFELMLGGAKQAQDFLAKLLQFAAATPFEMPQLRSAASRLLAVGTAAKDIIPLLTTLGDATAGMGTGAEGIERAVTALTQMRQKTKVTGEEMMQLTEAGIPAWETLAAKLKTDVATAMEMVTKRQVDAGVIFDAVIEKQGKGLSRLSGMMQKQSLSLEGLWSTFKDNTGQALAKMAEPAIPAIKKFLDFASNAVPKVVGLVSRGLLFLQNFANKIAEVFKGSDVPGRLLSSLREAGEHLLPKVKFAFDMILQTVRENRVGLEKLGRFIADVVIPVGGRVIEFLIVSTAGFIAMSTAIAAHVVPALRFLVKVVDDTLGTIIHAEAAAFGWVPELGPKLKKAAADFDNFVAGVNAGLDKLDGKTVDVWVNAHARGIVGEHGGSGVGSGSTLIGSSSVSTFGTAPGAPHQSFAEGGIVQGPYGSPQLIVAHAGEKVLTPAQQSGPADYGTVTVVLQWPDGSVIRQQLLAHKRQRGFSSLGLT